MAHIEALHELNGKLVFFMTQSFGNKAVLNRVSMNTASGEPQGEQQILDFEWRLSGQWYGDDGKIYTPFQLAADEAAGTYAIAVLRSGGEAKMEVFPYDANHREIKRYPYKFIYSKRNELFAI